MGYQTIQHWSSQSVVCVNLGGIKIFSGGSWGQNSFYNNTRRWCACPAVLTFATQCMIFPIVCKRRCRWNCRPCAKIKAGAGNWASSRYVLHRNTRGFEKCWFHLGMSSIKQYNNSFYQISTLSIHLFNILCDNMRIVFSRKILVWFSYKMSYMLFRWCANFT